MRHDGPDQTFNSGNKCPTEIKFYSLDGGNDGEHSGIGFVEACEIFAMHGLIFFGIIALDRVCRIPGSAE